MNDILDFSKFEAGRFGSRSSTMTWSAWCAIWPICSPPRRTTRIDLIDYLPPDLPTALLGDPGRIRQVLTNLASNPSSSRAGARWSRAFEPST